MNKTTIAAKKLAPIISSSSFKTFLGSLGTEFKIIPMTNIPKGILTKRL